MKYIVNFISLLSTQSKLNAQGKAREDVTRTMVSLGYKEIQITRIDYPMPFNKKRNIPIISGLKEYISILFKCRNIKKGDTVFFQDFAGDHQQFMIKKCKAKGARVAALVHDVMSVRFGGDTNNDIKALNSLDYLYVHTPAMKNRLLELGVKTPMKPINLFDYYSEDEQLDVEKIAKEQNTIIFAGNLMKSEFIGPLINSEIDKRIKYRLYGFRGNRDFSKNSQIEYAGFFKPEHTATIHGGWGLVWDGDSIDTCSGELGEYLRYNLSHKISLYLCAGIPIILWSKSSIAEWTIKNKVGFCVDSLSDIPNKIAALSEEEYREMITNARNIGLKLREGYYLKHAIE